MKSIFTKLRFLILAVFLLGTSSYFINRPTLTPDFKNKNQDVWISVVRKLDAVPNTFSLSSLVSLVPAVHASAVYDNAKSYIAIDENTGEIIAEKNATEPLPIASLTKIMSSVVALDLARPEDLLTVSRKASQMVPTKIGVVPGQKMTVDELLHAMLMTSANDAAQAVADGVNDKYKANIFVDAMNEKARFLGLSQTHFANSQGFDDTHNKSSAHDLAILSTYALTKYPLIRQIAGEDYIQLPSSTLHKQFDLYNWNGLLDVYPGAYGLKIGNTEDAGYTTVVSATREGHSILVVLLGAPGVLERDLWAAALLDDAFASFYNLPPVNILSSQLQEKYATWQYWD